jgi:hypothetical protein
MKEYMLLFNETPGMKPIFDRSPTSIKRTLNNSPNSNVNNNNNNNNNTSNQQISQPKIEKLISSQFNPKPSDTLATRTRTDLVIQRSVMSTSQKKTNVFTEQAKSLGEYSKSTADFSQNKLRNGLSSSINPVRAAKQQPSLTSLELKPATVEVFFRSTSGKSQRIERKAIPATVFPPPKISLKST